MNIARYYDRLFANQWMMKPESFTALMCALRVIDSMKGADDMTPFSLSLMSAVLPTPQAKPAYTLDSNGVATVQMHGTMAMSPDAFEEAYLGMCSTERVGEAIMQAVADTKVRSILLDIDSPGGTVNGTPELASLVDSMSAVKPIVSYTATKACSAAYYVGSQASAVLASPSAAVGNIGAVISYLDISKALDNAGAKMEVIHNADSPLKGIGTFGTALSDDHRAFMQGIVDDSAAAFKQSVGLKRGCSAEAMGGGWYSGHRAMGMKLVDQLCDRRTALKTAAQLAR